MGHEHTQDASPHEGDRSSPKEPSKGRLWDERDVTTLEDVARDTYVSNHASGVPRLSVARSHAGAAG
jgi:hypothetical protein